MATPAAKHHRTMTFRPDISDLKLKTLALSNRQYAALRLFEDGRTRLSVMDAIAVDQRSLGSLYYRGYLKFDGSAFSLSAVGKQALGLYETTNIVKEHPTIFSSYIRTIRSLEDVSYKDLSQ